MDLPDKIMLSFHVEPLCKIEQTTDMLPTMNILVYINSDGHILFPFFNTFHSQQQQLQDHNTKSFFIFFLAGKERKGASDYCLLFINDTEKVAIRLPLCSPKKNSIDFVPFL